MIEQIERSKILDDKEPLFQQYCDLVILFGFVGMFSTLYQLAPLYVLLSLYLQLMGKQQFSISLPLFRRFLGPKQDLQTKNLQSCQGHWSLVRNLSVHDLYLDLSECLTSLHQPKTSLGMVCKRRNSNLLSKYSYISFQCEKEDMPEGFVFVSEPEIYYCMERFEFLILVGIIEHVFLIIKVLVNVYIIDSPEWVELFKKKEYIRRQWGIKARQQNHDRLLTSQR